MHAPPPPKLPSGTRPRIGRVLLLDDDARSAGSIVGALADHLEVTVLADPTEAVVRIAAGTRFDVILCDLTLRAMNGAEVFARICAASPRQAMRIVFLSSGTMPLALAEFLSRVTNLCLQRPLDLGALRALVDRRVDEAIARSVPDSAKIA
jgi:CheY-like chemotaxis protein